MKKPGGRQSAAARHGHAQGLEHRGAEARAIIAGVHEMIRCKAEADLVPWIERGRSSLVAPFANAVAHDIAAVRAATASPWTNGQTEGQITKLKLVKRQMYGRGKLDWLEARVIGRS